MNNSIKLSLKCRLGEKFKPDFSEIKIGKYTISSLPSENLEGFKTELLLSFIDEWKEGQQGSNPEREAEIITSWLSTILKQKLKICSSRLNNLQISKTNKQFIYFEPLVDFPINLLDLYNKLKSMPLEKLERYARACNCYQEALITSNDNPSISFFLFVISLECISNKGHNFYEYLIKELYNKEEISKKEIDEIYGRFNEEYGAKRNFISFILSNFNEWKEKFTEEEFKKMLSSVYDIRSLFTHEGENLEKHINLIDNLKSKTVFTSIKDKKLEFPGLNYLSEIVRKVLINFLEEQQAFEIDNLPELALKDSIVNLDLVKDEAIKRGILITKDRIKYRD